jgi:hypothetical protein
MLTAYHVAKGALPEYSSRYSRKDFTLPQLFACLVLKEFERKDYRGAEQLLADCRDLREPVGLKKAPDHCTLQRAAVRLLNLRRANRLLDECLAFARACRVLPARVAVAALDSSGFESRHVSRYYVRRRANDPRRTWQDLTYGRVPKLAAAVDCATHLVLSFWCGTGPKPDVLHWDALLYHAWRRCSVRKAVADAGFDAEWAHELARRDMGVRSVIPPRIGKPSLRPPAGRWRRHMRSLLRTKRRRRRCGYTRRWQAETVNSMVKRNLGSALRARSDASRDRELALRVLAHNFSLLLQRVATEQVMSPLSCPPLSCPFPPRQRLRWSMTVPTANTATHERMDNVHGHRARSAARRRRRANSVATTVATKPATFSAPAVATPAA